MQTPFTLVNNILLRSSTTFLFFLLLSISVHSQDKTQNNSIESKFTEYSKSPREIAFAHLNKSVYIKGETVAFKVYVFDKYDKGLSKLTKNLYWTISDNQGKVIKEAMLLVEEGVADGNFFADDLFTSGNYTLTTYTNWMKNFNEQNYYVQNIKIIDPDVESEVSSRAITSKLDAQFLPEGGHLVANTKNTMGVIIKDSLGFGVPFVSYNLLDSKNEILTTNKTNAYGISKFDFTPNASETYHVILDFQGESQNFFISKAEKHGITMSLKDLSSKVAIKFGTNNQTLPQIKNKVYTLAIHNGETISTTKIQFNTVPEVLAIIKYEELSPGINVFTLFDENKTPILERMFFNYEGIKTFETGNLRREKDGDSLKISIPVKNLIHNSKNSFSVSVLPEATKSYNPHQNILSSVYLQPFVQGQIEDAGSYFTNIDRKKKFELDNLLLTQGWSSYEWSTIFNAPPQLVYDFESGVRFTANANKSRTGRFMMYPTNNNEAETFIASADDQSFEKVGLFPLENEKVRLGEVNKNQSVGKPSVYVQFSPSTIPRLNATKTNLPIKENTYFDSNAMFPIIESSWSDIEKLDEVVLSVKKSKIRIEKLQSSPFEKVDILDDKDRFAFTDFASYIRTKRFTVTQDMGEFRITNNSVMKSGFLKDEIEGGSSPKGSTVISRESLPSKPTDQGVPAIYLDGVLLTDHSILYSFDMGQVDYVAVNNRGFGQGMKGGGGVIKIFTDPSLGYRSGTSAGNYQEIDIPLTFSAPKKFYAPKYQSYSNQFFKDYGVVDWIPNATIDSNGNLTFKISDTQQTNLHFYIEGTSGNGKFLSDVKTLML